MRLRAFVPLGHFGFAQDLQQTELSRQRVLLSLPRETCNMISPRIPGINVTSVTDTGVGVAITSPYTINPVNADHAVVVTCTLKTYSVNFNANGGTPTTPNVSETYGASYAVPSPDPTRTGYDFVGWYDAASGGAVLSGTVPDPPPADFYAHWTLKTYLVNFNANGGTPTTPNVSETYGASYAVPSPDPTRTGYDFAGWYDAASGGAVLSGTVPDPPPRIFMRSGHSRPGRSISKETAERQLPERERDLRHILRSPKPRSDAHGL